MKIRYHGVAVLLALALPSLAFADSCRKDCGKVVSIDTVKQKGKGGAVGMIAGGVVGGLLGHQIGAGNGKTLATVAGAAGGAYAGNEVQKKVSEKTVQVVKVKMDSGQIRTFRFSKAPVVKGDRVHLADNRLVRYTGK
ncbi:glycine zipper 2TM domain-containing protein [Rugosibacter aromaticivorans]|uniref:glycine zipper 2TM domain-containing protein n=1 Tax=Rugosibacter aromaticivorans TaxID=1565605 RepID=UPI00192A4614|nr:glycine zipper 2TM domain-containing protein [Rugosibacter aromaticivorans]